jgi:protein-S-isoprenylcysteine O-methyltransferase Ste14
VIIPSLLGAFGLLRLKTWGWAAAILVCGGYLHGLIGLLTGAALTSGFNMMSMASVYIILFSIGFVIYLWRQRTMFAWS